MKINYVNVSFDISSSRDLRAQGGLYLFKSVEDLSDGDLVVVRTVNGYGVARVVNTVGIVTKNEVQKATAWIIQKVDLEAFEKVLEKENKLIELKQKMDARKALLEEEAVYRMLAEKDPVMKALLEEMSGIE